MSTANTVATTQITENLNSLTTAISATNTRLDDLVATLLAQVKEDANAHIITAIDHHVGKILDRTVSTQFKDRMDARIKKQVDTCLRTPTPLR